jgi:hypothetical protein
MKAEVGVLWSSTHTHTRMLAGRAMLRNCMPKMAARCRTISEKFSARLNRSPKMSQGFYVASERV